MKTHELKCLRSLYTDLAAGTRAFDYRLNDRDYMVGDRIVYHEYDPSRGRYTFTGSTTGAEVTTVWHGGRLGLPEGYCILGIKVDKLVGP